MSTFKCFQLHLRLQWFRRSSDGAHHSGARMHSVAPHPPPGPPRFRDSASHAYLTSRNITVTHQNHQMTILHSHQILRNSGKKRRMLYLVGTQDKEVHIYRRDKQHIPLLFIPTCAHKATLMHTSKHCRIVTLSLLENAAGLCGEFRQGTSWASERERKTYIKRA